MKITKKVIEELLLSQLGPRVIPVFNYIRDKKNISEFILAEDIDYEIHEVRQILYKMHDLDLVTYIRKKDRKKGWYISYWTFNVKKVRDLIIRLKKKKLNLLNGRLYREEENLNSFFMCRNACTRLDFDKAMEFEFKCPECGELLMQQENSKTIDHLRKQIKELEKEIKQILKS